MGTAPDWARQYDHLEIPEFLRRKGAPTAPTQEIKERKPRMKKRKGDWYEAQLTVEIPKLGSGYRTFELVKLGTKWVYVRKDKDSQRIKISREVWDKLKKKRLE
jgi:hypothetical protein